MFIKMRIRKWFRKQQTIRDSEEGIIYATITILKKHSQLFSTGIQVVKSEWDSKRQLITGKANAILNDELRTITTTILSIKQNL
jgi:hypothetical protein